MSEPKRSTLDEWHRRGDLTTRDALWRAACWEASADERTTKHGADEDRKRAAEILAAHAAPASRRVDPTYETSEHQRREEETARRLARCWQCEQVKIGGYRAPLDRELSRGGLVLARAEIKNRQRAYPTVMIEEIKWLAGLAWTAMSRLPAFLVVTWPVDGRLVAIAGQVRPIETIPGVIVHPNRKRNDRDDEPKTWYEVPLRHFAAVVEGQVPPI